MFAQKKMAFLCFCISAFIIDHREKSKKKKKREIEPFAARASFVSSLIAIKSQRAKSSVTLSFAEGDIFIVL